MIENDEEIKLSFLLSGSCDLPPSCVKLRSYLNTHLSNIADEHNIKLLKSLRNRNKTCPYCYTTWNADTTSFKLLPTKKFNALAQGKVDDSVKELRNTLVLKCRVCTKKSPFSLVKGKHVKEKANKDVALIKNKSNESVVSLKKMDYQSPGMLTNKKKRMGNSQGTPQGHTNLGLKSPQDAKNKPRQSMKLAPNPFAIQTQNQLSKKKDKKLERLKQAVKQEQSSVKKTLQDFLSLV